MIQIECTHDTGILKLKLPWISDQEYVKESSKDAALLNYPRSRMGCSASSCTPRAGKRILRWSIFLYSYWLSLYQPLLWYFCSLSFPAQPWQRGLWELRRAWKSSKENEREGLGGGCGGEQDWESSRTDPAANILVKGERNHSVPSGILRICKFLE